MTERVIHPDSPTMSHQPPVSAQSQNVAVGMHLQLKPNTPNPFIEMTLLCFHLPEASLVTVRIFDARDREVHQWNGRYDAGEHHLVLHRSDLGEPGFYTYLVESDFGTASRKLMMY